MPSDWSFAPGSILAGSIANTAPKAVFHAVCDELARWFEPKGFRYTRARPRLRLVRDDLSLELAFWSSRSNMVGEHVRLEVVADASSRRLGAWSKANGYGNGCLASFKMFDRSTERYGKYFDVAHTDPTSFVAMATGIEHGMVAAFDRLGDLERTIPAAIANDQSSLDFEHDLLDDSFLAYLVMLGRNRDAAAFLASHPHLRRDQPDLDARLGLA